MIKELDIIARWKAQINWEKDFGWTKELDAVEKALKALDIIKEKKPDIYEEIEYCDCYEEYTSKWKYVRPEWNLTREEFDLLKEVLS